MTLNTADFDYPLDEELIAQSPADRRDRSRLMLLRRADGALSHHVFADLPTLLRSGDVLVVNDTRVIPARFFCERSTGGRIEGLFCHERPSGAWEVLLRDAGRCRPGEALALRGAPGVRLALHEKLGGGRWLVAPQPPGAAEEILRLAGRTPLPPYIRRTERDDDTDDRRRYQTVYAARGGAVAAPTAGLHFTEDLLAQLADRDIRTVAVTLHVGPGTFAPVRSDTPDGHTMHAEWYELSAPAAATLAAARRAGRRLVAVGTTSVRVLETIAAAARPGEEPPAPGGGWTDLFLYPPAAFGLTDALVTNFHLPKSTLLMLVAAFCAPGRIDGRGTLLRAYAEAARLRYRFYSYGDAMLIE